jgi:GH25 family lysozyme M1 (1,4-beta-N-acetylmuramidase)
MKIAYDISHYKDVPDFSLVNPRPTLFITKATEAHPGSIYNHTDEKFLRFFDGMASIGVHRGVYHFNRNAYNPYRQAEHFLKVISQVDILPTDFLILDAEEEGKERASALWAWFETVRKEYPNNPLRLYSTANILNQVYMTVGEKEYFRKIKVWTAGYPFLRLDYSQRTSVPAGYIPDQSKYGEVDLWQYSEVGRVSGIIGAVDLNWMSESLYAQLGETVVGESIMTSYRGTCITTAKVWNQPGGSTRVYPDIRVGEDIEADERRQVSGIWYLHLTSPTLGWSKAQWFDYEEDTIPPPPPPPDMTEDFIEVYVNGVLKLSGLGRFTVQP